MEYTHNDFTKNYYNMNTQNYIIKVNSRDRNILNEPNPFDFKIKFNKVQGKNTIYYQKGYFGSGNKFKSNLKIPSLTQYNETNSQISKTLDINVGAVIEDKIDEIKEFNISDIVAPRFIPDSIIGLEIFKVEAITNPNDKCGIFLRGIDNTRINFIYDEDTDGNSIYFFQIQDLYSNKYYLFNSTDYNKLVSNDSTFVNIKKNYYLFNDYYTDTLYLNNQIYTIGSIENCYIKLSNGTEPIETDFIKSGIRLPKYYTDYIYYQPSEDTNISVTDTTITIADKAESLITYDLVKNSALELDVSGSLHYFNITSVLNSIKLTIEEYFDNVEYIVNNTGYNEIVISNLTTYQINILKLLTEEKNISFNDGSIDITVKGIKIVNNNNVTIETNTSINEVNDINGNRTTTQKTFTFTKNIEKKYPNVNLSDFEYLELEKFINATDETNISNTVTITGSWYDYNGSTSPTIDSDSIIKINHLKPGVKDLLNEKLFYLSLDPIVPSKNLITNNKLNNVVGTFYPSTQSKNYIFLSGQNRQKYTHRNLQNLRELRFKLYYNDGTAVGETLQNYSLDYLTMECKQTNITFSADQVDRHFS